MKFTDEDILLASLLGSKFVEQVPRLSAVENELQKRVGFPIPFLPFKNKVIIDEQEANVENNQVSIYEQDAEELDAKIWKANPSVVDNQFFPLKVRRAESGDPFFTLPYEPMISITGKNKIVKRSIAKAPNFIGTIKEHWSQDDYDITIAGALYGENESGGYSQAFPKSDFEALKNYCISPTGLEIECEILQLLGIKFIVVEDFNFPFSKGENVQAYDIKAVSDFSAKFLLEIKE
jgi:hypothetical protein